MRNCRRLVILATTVVLSVLPLTGCLGACSALSPFAYPHAWDFARSRPKDSDLVGIYKVLKVSGSPAGLQSTATVQIVLRADHTAEISAIPEYDGFGERIVSILTGKGTWQSQMLGEVTLQFFPSKIPPTRPRRASTTSLSGFSDGSRHIAFITVSAIPITTPASSLAGSNAGWPTPAGFARFGNRTAGYFSMCQAACISATTPNNASARSARDRRPECLYCKPSIYGIVE